MKLNTIRLIGYRCFKDIQVDLNEKLTVFVANNGAGKTSILDAIATAFGAYLTRLPQVQGRKFSPKDLRKDSNNKLAPFMSISARIYDDELCAESGSITNGLMWNRLEKRDQSKNTSLEIQHIINESVEENKFTPAKTRLEEINHYADRIVDAINDNEVITIPVLAYYGTGRGVFDLPARRRGFGKNFERLDAYTQCLDPKTNFRKFFEYFYFLEDAERREKEEIQSFEHRKPELEVIRKALNSFLSTFSNPRTELSPLRFLLDRVKGSRNEEFNIEMLSDGYRTSIAMVMDLASRMAEANPHLKADALQSPGVVLIDEVDMHLHPSWQQTIIQDLQRTFPNIQFICTTHSPQVLSTVDNEHIRLIMDDHSISRVHNQTEGKPSHEILSMVMDVDPRPKLKITEELSEYTAHLQGGGIATRTDDEWEELFNKLCNHFGETSPQILYLNRLNRFENLKHEISQFNES